MKILVDADAIPRSALTILKRVSKLYGATLTTVSSLNHEIQHESHIQVDAGPDAADLEIVKHVTKDALVITQDYGLAAMVLARGGQAISPHGRIYSDANIDILLAERAHSAKTRRSGKVRQKGPKARTEEDDRRFEETLCEVLEAMKQ